MKKTVAHLQPSGLRNLRAYQLAKQLGRHVYDVTSYFPKDEYRLISQMRGAAVSVFGNIAEGYGRNALGDYIRFCEIARGSLAELGSYIEFCQEQEILKTVDEQKLNNEYNHSWNTLGALIRSLRDKRVDGSWDRSYKTIKEESDNYDF